MDPEGDRELGIRFAGSGSPDIQVEAVLAVGLLGAVTPLSGVAAGIVDGLEAGVTEDVADLHALPGGDRLGLFPTEVADRGCCIRDSAIDGDTFLGSGDTLDLATFDGEDRAAALFRCAPEQNECGQKDQCFSHG
jgi:hypothetical protein